MFSNPERVKVQFCSDPVKKRILFENVLEICNDARNGNSMAVGGTKRRTLEI